MGVWNLENLNFKFLKLKPMKFIGYHSIPIFPRPT